ncbi:hypothetical protein [Desulfovulcanus sp.]
MNSFLQDNESRLVRVNKKRIKDRDIDELIGMCRGILADGVVNQSEAEFLQKWLHDNRHILHQWPANVLVARLDECLKDGFLDKDEQKELFELLSQATGEKIKIAREKMSFAPFDQPLPEIEFDGRYFCFTGKFAFGKRSDCVREVESLGGYVVDKVDPCVDYLVVGFFGSPAWAHSTFGRKIEQALRCKREAGKPFVVPEDHWADELARVVGEILV